MRNMLDDLTCVDCKFSEKAIGEDSSRGFCRRYPPTVISYDPHDRGFFKKNNIKDSRVAPGVYPLVVLDATWCGEFVKS